jgi:hypothetical protein
MVGAGYKNLKSRLRLAAKNLALNSEIKIYPNPVEGNMIQISTKTLKLRGFFVLTCRALMVFRTNEVLNDGIVIYRIC